MPRSGDAAVRVPTGSPSRNPSRGTDRTTRGLAVFLGATIGVCLRIGFAEGRVVRERGVPDDLAARVDPLDRVLAVAPVGRGAVVVGAGGVGELVGALALTGD
jgi:hypothetical protein